MLGRVDDVDGHYIATKFLGLILPTSSMYVTGETYSRSGNVSTMTWSGVPVRFNWKSALLAYPRVWLWAAAFALPFVLHWGQNFNSVPTSTWLLSGGLMVLALLFAFVPGRLSASEKERLRVLGRVTGLRIDPKKLTPWTRGDKREFLDAELTKIGVATTPEGILAAAAAASPASLEVLYTFACYAGDDPEWRRTAAQVLELRRRLA